MRPQPALTTAIYSHPPKASYGVASPRRTTSYCLRRRALSETFGGWLYIHLKRSSVCGEFTIQVQQLQKKASISDTAKNIKTLQETANGYLQTSSPIERGCIMTLHEPGYSLAAIATILKRHRSTILRELKRNSDGKTYQRQQGTGLIRQPASGLPPQAQAR